MQELPAFFQSFSICQRTSYLPFGHLPFIHLLVHVPFGALPLFCAWRQGCDIHAQKSGKSVNIGFTALK
jgi:hypothetical protein